MTGAAGDAATAVKSTAQGKLKGLTNYKGVGKEIDKLKDENKKVEEEEEYYKLGGKPKQKKKLNTFYGMLFILLILALDPPLPRPDEKFD